MNFQRTFGGIVSLGKTKPRRPQAEKKLQEILAAHGPLIRKTTLAILISRFVPALIPIQLKTLLDPLLQQKNVHGFGFQFSPPSILAIVVATCAIVALVRGIAEYVSVATAGRCGHSMVANLRVAMYEHLLRIPASYVDRRGTGKVLLRFIGDSDALRTWVSRRAPAVFVDRCLLMVLIGIMFFVDWRLASVVLLPVPLIILCARQRGPRLFDMTLVSRAHQAKLSGDIGNRIALIRQSKWLDRFRANRQAIHDRAQVVANQNSQRDRQAAILQGTGQFLAFVSVPLLLLAGVLLAWQNSITIGQFVAFVWLSAHLAITIHRLNASVVLQKKADVSASRILKLLERSAESGRSSTMQKFSASGQSLVVENVRTKNGPGPINLRLEGHGLKKIENGVSIRGLIDFVMGFQNIDEGRVLLDGQDISKLQIESVRKQMGWMVQDPIIIQGTIRENILMARPEMDFDELNQWLCNLKPDLDNAWVDQQVSFFGHELTDTDRHRVSIFRALLNNPKFIFVDFSTVDENMIRLLVHAVERQHQHAMILAAEPVYDLIADALAKQHDRTISVFGLRAQD